MNEPIDFQLKPRVDKKDKASVSRANTSNLSRQSIVILKFEKPTGI